ncbi:hypothetical protein K1719_040642 [Acacia pycnantha]|nr:hypothetical protein K1719_040642 [Acacia pycnantha]
MSLELTLTWLRKGDTKGPENVETSHWEPSGGCTTCYSNLITDEYLQRRMDEQGWVPVRIIAGFPKPFLKSALTSKNKYFSHSNPSLVL